MRLEHHSERWILTGEWQSRADTSTVAKLWRITPIDDDAAAPRYEACVYRGGRRIDTIQAGSIEELTTSLESW